MKLSFWTIIIIAISVSVAILSFAILHQFLPTRQATEQINDYRAKLDVEYAKAGRAKDRVRKAERQVRLQEARWNAYAATRTPEADVARGGISLDVNPLQLTVDTQKFRNSIQRAVDIQVRKGGVKVLGPGPYVRGPQDIDDASLLLAEYYNYPRPLQAPAVIFDLGTVTVQGTYDQIMANVRSYKSMPRYLAVAHNLSISGTSPNLIGTYDLSIVGFIRAKSIFPSATSVGAPAAGGSGAMAPGMGSPMGGGYGGGPSGPPMGRGEDR